MSTRDKVRQALEKLLQAAEAGDRKDGVMSDGYGGVLLSLEMSEVASMAECSRSTAAKHLEALMADEGYARYRPLRNAGCYLYGRDSSPFLQWANGQPIPSGGGA